MTEYDISCRRLTDLSTDYLEDAMDVALRTTFEQHLVFCDFCVAHIGQLRATRTVLASLNEGAVPAGDGTAETPESTGG